jgi:hypothetical protein
VFLELPQTYVFDQPVAALVPTAPDTSWDERLGWAVKALGEKMEGFKNDAVVHALTDLKDRLAGSSAVGPIVKVELPESYGGPRELDAALVRLLVERIKQKYHVEVYTDEARQDAPSNFSEAIDAFNAKAEQHNQALDALGDIPDKLQAAGKDAGQ